jgi:hypothetical protein
VYEWARTPANGYNPIKFDQFPELIGISPTRLAQLLWWSFHEEGESKTGSNNKPMSIAPLTWAFPDEIMELVREAPGLARFANKFELPVTGLAHVEVPLGVEFTIQATPMMTPRTLKFERDNEVIEEVVNELRTRLVLNDGRYLTLPPECPILDGEFKLVLSLKDQGKGRKRIVIGAFERAREVDLIPKPVMALIGD